MERSEKMWKGRRVVLDVVYTALNFFVEKKINRMDASWLLQRT